MGETKIRLSEEEMQLLLRSDWILTKNRVIQKAKDLLETLQATQEDILSLYPQLPEEVRKISPKVSKGENYKGLPWLMLDQPRYFSRDNIFAIRSFFWWGHFFSCTLHLSGSYKIFYEKKIINRFDELKKAGIFICISQDQWEHHFEEDNFVSIDNLPAKQFVDSINKSSFIKLSRKFSLEQWDDAGQILREMFSNYLSILEK
jgi:hypothetical protein